MKHYNDTYSCPSCGNYFYGENEEPKEWKQKKKLAQQKKMT
jgi:hypothetical protein